MFGTMERLSKTGMRLGRPPRLLCLLVFAAPFVAGAATVRGQDECFIDEDCEDIIGDCRVWRCDLQPFGDNRCRVDQDDSNAICDDGQFCEGAAIDGREVCAAKACVGGINNGVVCEDSFDCPNGTCEPTATPGQCIDDFEPDEPCPSGQFCSESLGLCIECDSDGDCDDNDLCTGSESCDLGTFTCIAGTPLVCSHLTDECNVGMCDPVTGCFASAIADGVSCTDNDTCTLQSECSGGVCVGVPTNGCVDLRLEVSGPETVRIGDWVDVRLYAQANGCSSASASPCAPADAAIVSLEVLFVWDPLVLELADPAITGENNPERPCGCYFDGVTCFGPDPCVGMYCGDSLHHVYDWASATFPDDCVCEGGANEGERCNTDADCAGGICAERANAPCTLPGSNDFPFNDGTGFFASLAPVEGCDGASIEPACAAAMAPGLWVATLKFKAIGDSGPGGTPIGITDCIAGKGTRVQSALTPGLDLLGLIEPPTVVIVSSCDPPTVVAEGSRYMAVTPAEGPDAVAIRVSGHPDDPDVSCVVGYAQSDGRVLEAGVGQAAEGFAFYQPPGTGGWNTAHLRGEGLIGAPSATDVNTYIVQTDCDPGNPGINLSDPVSVTLWRYGDVGGVFGPDDTVDFVDITMVVDGFRNTWGTPKCCFTDPECSVFGPLSICNTVWDGCQSPVETPGRCQSSYVNVDLKGGFGCTPDTVVDFVDITAVVDAFRNVPDSCSALCP